MFTLCSSVCLGFLLVSWTHRFLGFVCVHFVFVCMPWLPFSFLDTSISLLCLCSLCTRPYDLVPPSLPSWCHNLQWVGFFWEVFYILIVSLYVNKFWKPVVLIVYLYWICVTNEIKQFVCDRMMLFAMTGFPVHLQKWSDCQTNAWMYDTM